MVKQEEATKRQLIWGDDIGCLQCKHFRSNKWGTCAAFDRIPYVIASCEHDHTEPYPGDGGIQFEAIDREE